MTEEQLRAEWLRLEQIAVQAEFDFDVARAEIARTRELWDNAARDVRIARTNWRDKVSDAIKAHIAGKSKGR